jgi:uroporphyrinogen decarboxylase
MSNIMSSYERVVKLFTGETPDRIVVLPQIGDHAGWKAGISMDLIYHDVEKTVEAHLLAYKKYGYDIVAIQVEPSWPVAEACGCDVTYPKDKCPWITKNIIHKAEDIDNLQIPDFYDNPATRTILEATKILKQKIGKEAMIAGYITGPLTFALQLMPYTDFVINMKKDPHFIKALVSKSTEIGNAFLGALKDAGAELAVICEHDLQLLSPKMWQDFSLDFLAKQTAVFEYNVLHTCGNVEKQLTTLATQISNIPNLQFINFSHEVSISHMAEVYGDSMGLCGNIDHIHLLPSAKTEEISSACKSAITEGLKASAFMLGPGCEITIDTPEENVKAFVESAELYGRYPS